jgi:transcriptional regulator with XRE-family HTH domain
MIRSRIERREALGDRVKSAREGRRAGGKRLTQTGLAKAVGVDRNTVSRWENGAMTPKDPATLAALAEALGVSLEWLISGDPMAFTGSNVHEGASAHYSDPEVARLPLRARALLVGYLDRLARSGCLEPQLRGAEALLIAGAHNSVSSVDIGERSDEDISADIDAAWDVVVRILRREGIRP